MKITFEVLQDDSPWRDWKPLNDALKALKPGLKIRVEAPRGFSMTKLQTQLINRAKQYHGPAGLRLLTRTDGRVLECKLVEATPLTS